MAKVAAATGLALTHRKKDRHGPDGGAKPAAKQQAMLAAVEKAMASGADPAKVKQELMAVRAKHRKG